MSQYRSPIHREDMPYAPVDPPPSGLLLEDDWMADQQNSKKWQIVPPMVTGGRIAAVKVNNNTSPIPASPYPAQQDRESDQQIQRSVPLTRSRPDTAALCRVSFVGQDQQWYSISIGKSMLAQAQSPVQTQPYIQEQPQQYIQTQPQQYIQAQSQPLLQAQSQPLLQAAPPVQTTSELNSAWREQIPDYMLGRAFPPLGERPSGTLPSLPKEEDTTSKDFLLQIVQPGLAGLMDGSVSTLAPIFSVAFATHQPFTTFLVGMASAVGAGISMTFSEALSDDGDITGRGKPFVRGGVTGLMTFISGAGHALPFLVPNIQLALLLAYAVVAVELLVIAAIRHKFFGTGWWISIVQVVGGGALVFIAAILLGNA